MKQINEKMLSDNIECVKALHAELGGDITQIEQSRHSGNEFSINGALYLVVTDDELDSMIMGKQDENGRTISLIGYGCNTEEKQQVINGITYLIYKKD